ncbi:MAG: type II toxin-antitoxin system Phd/YefM family antitoxin [Bdellovibrionota bacterium]
MSRLKKSQTIPISEFKAKALRLLEETSKHGCEYIVTKKGIPIARVVPIAASSPVERCGSLKGVIQIHEDIVHFNSSELWEAAEEP